METLDKDKLRLDLVKAYAIFEKANDKNLDDLTKAAALICDVKYSFISIIDREYIRFVSRYGFNLNESERAGSGCDIVVKTGKSLIIDDVSKIAEEKLNDLYTKKMGLLSYAGFPLETKEGVVIGTFCIADSKINSLSQSQVLTLETFANQVVRSLEAKKANLILEQMKGHFHEVQNISNAGYWELDIETGKTFWTSGVYKIHAVPENETFDKDSGINFYAPHEREKLKKVIMNCIEQGISFSEDMEFIDANSIHKWVRSKGYPVKDEAGQVVKLVGTFQDITSFRSQQKRQDYIFETMKVGTWDWNIKDNILEWDDSNYNVFGINKEDFSGAFDAWERSLHPDWKDKAMGDLQLALDGKQEFLSTFGILSGDNEVRYIGGRAEITRDENGEPIRMVGVNWDKTLEHETLMELEKQKHITFHQDKLASLGALAAGVGHEINNPMAIIKGYLEIMKGKFEKGELDKEALSKNFEHISKSIERVTSIVKGLKNISRSDNSELEHFDVCELLSESIDTISDIYRKEGVDLSLILDGNVSVFGNRGRIQQVIINLLANAKDAIEKSQNKTIEVKLLSNSNQNVIITVKDSGPGIPKSIQDKIFDPFFTSKDVNEGTGIGLSLCHQIISEHDGKISFNTSESDGTIFQVELPMSSFQEKTSVVLEQVDHSNAADDDIIESRGVILVAEDEIGIQDILKLLLEDMKFEVVIKSNGREAFDDYKENKAKYDLILSDIQMPEMTGLDFFKNVQGLDSERLPFVIMTGGVNAQDESYVKEVDGVILKPFDRDTMEETLLKALKRNKNSLAS